MLKERQEKLLNLVVDNHIKTAEPIGSRFLLQEGSLDVGEATIRNDLRALEEEGLLTHPHTSAGRIPTEKGYKYYLQNLEVEKLKLSKRENDILGMSLKQEKDYKQARKNLAKNISEISNNAVLLAFSLNSIYYTGLSNLFSQPEFRELELIGSVSQVFDHCEDCLEDFFDKVEKKTKVFVGADHSFGKMLSVVANKFASQSGEGLIMIMGPLRQNYKKNYALINKASEII